jgi:uncharacterized protein
MPSHFLAPLLKGPASGLTLRLEGHDLPLATKVEGAFDSASRNRGLLGRKSLAPDSALVIAPSNSVHTFFMRFPIDLVYAARDGRVVKVRHNVAPWRVSMALGAFAVIELAAGEARRCGVRRGDVLNVGPDLQPT